MALEHLGGMSIGVLYPVRSRDFVLADGADGSRGHFELLTENATDTRTRQFGREFGALGTILLRDAGVRRYRLQPGHATLVLPTTGDGAHPIECFVTCDTRYGLAIVMVNVHVATPDVDEMIFLMHGVGGRRDFGALAPHDGAAPGAGVRLTSGGACCPDGRHSLYCIARDCLDWFRADYLADGGVGVDPLTRSPLWCVEVKNPIGGDADVVAGGADAYIDADARTLYGLLTHDEGWRHVPLSLARTRLASRWGSRDFFSAVALGSAVLMVNFASPAYRREAERQWMRYAGLAAPPYFTSMNSEIAGLEHGALSALEHAAVWDIIEARCDALVRRATESLYQRDDALRRVGDKGRRKPSGKEMERVVDDLSLLQAHVVRDVDALIRRSISEVNVIAQLVRTSCTIDARMQLIKDQAETLASQLRVRAEERRNRTLALLAVIGTILTIVTLLTPVLSGPMQWSVDRLLRRVAPAARATLFYPNKPPDSTAAPAR